MSVLDLIPIKKPKKKAPKGVGTPPIEVPRYIPPLIPSQHPVPPRLARKLTALGRRYQTVHGADKLAQVICVAVALLGLQMFLDWLMNLSVLARLVLLAGDIALLVHFARRKIIPQVLRPPTLEACALMVEKRWPGLRGRVIAAVELARPRFTVDSPELVRSVQQDTDAKTAMMDFGAIVPTRILKRRAALAVILIILWCDLFVIFAPGSIALLERVFLLSARVPRKTEVICLSGNKTISTGDGVLLEARARGIIPSHGRITMVDDTGRIQEVTIYPERDHADRFGLQLDKVERSLNYTIRLNDGTSDTYQVRVLPQPHIASIDCEQTYPTYTGLEPVKRTVGNLALLAGSRLRIHAVADGRIVKATLKLVGLDKVMPLAIGGDNGTDLNGEIAIPTAGLTGFSLQITNEAGITSGDATMYGIDLIPDRPPTIQLTYPEKLQELSTIKAKPNIAFVASDDYGLERVTLCYRISQGSDPTADPTAPATAGTKRIAMILNQNLPLTMKNRYVWDLAGMQPPLTEGTTVEYWMEAQDGNNVTGPGITDSEPHTIKVVSEIEKRAEVMNRLMDSLNIITDISQSQVKANQQLGEVIEGKQEKK